jgi:surface antigen
MTASGERSWKVGNRGRGLRRLTAFGVLALLCVLAGAAPALAARATPMSSRSSARLPRITLASPTQVKAGGQEVIFVVAPRRASCQLTLSSSGHGTIRSAKKQVGKTALQEFIWSVPRNSATCKVTATVRCAGVAHVARVTIAVAGSHASAKLAGHISVVNIRSTEPPGFQGFGGAGYPAYGHILIPGSGWFGGHGVNVISNGYAGNVTPPNDVYQCVELVERFLTTEHFGPAIPCWGAQQMYGNASTAYYDRHPNGSGYIPVPGDVVVLQGGTYGHVAIVNQVVGGTVYIVEQNGSASGVAALSLNGSTLGKEYSLSVIGVLHAKANSTVPTPVPLPTPTPAPTPSVSGYALAFQANTGNLYTYTASGAANLQQGMMAGTSPSIAGLPGGGYEMAFQANTGDLIVFGNAGNVNTHQGMMAGTSPSIAASPTGGYQVAFQANTGNLYTYNSSSGAANLQQGMKAGTSPSIATLPGGGYEMAFQANTGDLIVFGNAGNVNTHQGMMAGTSPSIAASPSGGYQAAFQANTGNLYTYTASGAANLQQGMKAGTSPSIAALPGGGYEMAFQANTGNLIVFGSAGNLNTQQGMMAGTSPSIAASAGGGIQAAFQANTGNLYTFGSSSGAANLQQGMMTGTSPAVAAVR